MRPAIKRYKLYCIVLLLTGVPLFITAQNEGSVKKQKSIFSIGAGVQHGFIFAHSPEVENTKGAHPTGVELTFSWQRSDAPVWNLCNCFPRKGFILSYYDYDNNILGKSFSAAYLLEPTYRLSNKTFFSFKTVAGLSYLTRPFDTLYNPTNRSYSTHISGYLVVGAGLWFRVNEHWWLNASVNYQHESNGGLKQPNKGINWPTTGIALSYQKNPRPYYTGIRLKEKFWKDYSIRWSAGAFGIAKRVLDETGNSRRLPVAGISLAGSKQVGAINALTAGAEIFYDRALYIKLQQDSIDASAVRAGLMAGHEFILGRFLFSQQVGMYIYNQSDYFNRLFHRWGLQYRVSRHWGIGFNLLAHRHIADFIDFRVTYSWQKRGQAFTK